YFPAMQALIAEQGGTLDKTIGDAVMCFWNAPTSTPRHAESAVQCAQRMLDALIHLNQAWQKRGLPSIRIGIGINTGAAKPTRRPNHYTLEGDTINAASRLEAATKEHNATIIISEATYRATAGFAAEYLGELKVKGKQKPLRAYRIA